MLCTVGKTDAPSKNLLRLTSLGKRQSSANVLVDTENPELIFIICWCVSTFRLVPDFCGGHLFWPCAPCG